ncbi:efflux RND transporter periplasmic adaptor subunit [Chitinophaga japonensis]|uniref:RND family efflux transporter MFP subunit n=1 Tax=Chitinophaga japonensis TaxID=104662 RepID=A0A562TFJ4_CHIJA|nr:efflux RND transporter periplasmic adaptor subunit [Chitinophaga japonensis]TWI92143.1 RND family efflux transporter MFP subunit [Chitinophaga japonensis]
MNIHRIYSTVTATLLLAACGQEKHTAAEAPRPVVTTVLPRSGSAGAVITASGMIASSQEVALSFKTGGMVAQVYVEEGQYVQQGALLARLNTTELEAQLLQADLNIEKLQRDAGRLQQLVKDTIATLEQLQNTQTSLSAAVQQKRSMDYNLSQASLYAPAPGFVLQRQVNPGEYKTPGSPVFIIGSNMDAGNPKWVFKAGLSDKDRVRVQEGQSAAITLDALPGQVFTGKVSRLSAIPEAQTGTYNCYISFEPGPAHMVYGLTGKLSIQYAAGDQYTLLPLDALMAASGDTALVYTVLPDSTVQQRSVHIHSIHGDAVAIEEPWPRNLPVITAGKNDAVPGKKITIAQ